MTPENLFVQRLGPGLDHGGPVRLRPLLPDDLGERYAAWFRDEQVTRYLEARGISAVDALRHLMDGFLSEAWFMYAIEQPQPQPRHVGNLKIGPINRRHATAEISIVIGERDCWGRGAATEAVRLGTELAFGRFGLRKLYAGMVEGNEGSVRAFVKAGWRIEAQLPGAFIHDGVVKGKTVVSIDNPDFVLGG